MQYFVKEGSIVREIWGKSDTILIIFAGASAEFALNKAVDWLYFTGKLPADPLGRLFSTVSYARQIVFAPEAAAHKAIDTITTIHAGVEAKRGARIPEWAYRDVLFMLIDYSIRAYELLERKLTDAEKSEVYDVFYRMGSRMAIPELPLSYKSWIPVRAQHLQDHMVYSRFTADLYQQYKKHLGLVRYTLLREAQKLVTPALVSRLLGLGRLPLLAPVISLYKISRSFKADKLLKAAILPTAYKAEIDALDKMAA